MTGRPIATCSVALGRLGVWSVLVAVLLPGLNLAAQGQESPSTQPAVGSAGVEIEVKDAEVEVLQSGDRLIAWWGEPRSEDGASASGEIHDGFDILQLRLSAPGFRRLHLTLQRGARVMPVVWTDESLPISAAAAEEAVALGAEHGPGLERRLAWGDVQRAMELDGREDLDAQEDDVDADLLWQRAADRCRKAGLSLELALLLREWAWKREESDFDQARDLYRQVLDLLNDLDGPSLLHAQAHLNLGTLYLRQGDSRQAEPLLDRALEIHRRLAPETVLLTRNQNNLALALSELGRLREAEALSLEQLEVVRRLEPESLREARAHNNLGIFAYLQGDLAGAELRHRRAKELREKLAPGSLAVARSLNNLAALAEDRGELDKAELWFLQALDLRRRLLPRGEEVMSTLANLATLNVQRGEIERAVTLAREAHSLAREVAPGSDTESWATKVLAFALLKGTPTPERLAEAASLAARSVELSEQLSPGSMFLADSLETLAEVRLKQGDLDAAESAQQQGLALRAHLAPESRWQAASLYSLAQISRRRDRTDEALERLEQAIDMAESASALPAGSPRERATAAAEFVDWYRTAGLWQFERGELGRAFDYLERSRFQSLSALLQHRRLVFERDLPPEVENERRWLDSEYERVWQTLQASTDQDELHAQTLNRLNELRDQRHRLQNRMVSLAPRLAQLEAPQAPALDEVLGALPPSSLLLMISMGPEQGLMIALAATSDGRRLARGHTFSTEGLGDRIDALSTLLRSGASTVDGVKALSRELYDRLVGPVDDLIRSVRRLIVVPDGQLFRLPMAVLQDRQGRFLVQRMPVSIALSASAAGLAAVGEPAVGAGKPAMASDDPETMDDSETWVIFGDPDDGRPGLDWSRKEARWIRQLHPGPSTLYLDDDASETGFRSLGAEADVLHFAGHAEADDRFPLDSFLSLAPDRQHNGRLQAWEIFESLRIRARLVVLSGCETGLGKSVDGAGLAGLTRAFLFAGAEQVVSSQWQVDDRSTALLMTRFYHHLRAEAGDRRLSVEEALRAAQLDLLEGRAVWIEPEPGSLPEVWLDKLGRWARGDAPASEVSIPVDLSHPNHWAAFQVTAGAPVSGPSAEP